MSASVGCDALLLLRIRTMCASLPFAKPRRTQLFCTFSFRKVLLQFLHSFFINPFVGRTLHADAPSGRGGECVAFKKTNTLGAKKICARRTVADVIPAGERPKPLRACMVSIAAWAFFFHDRARL